ncbi:MAG: DUF927 domain-containing protein [Rhodoferax sp.]|nr:DUF927 domain-containing protein [Rhodoferax sp.]
MNNLPHTEAERALSALQAINPDCDRDTWFRVLSGAKDAGISFDDASAWSTTAPSYDQASMRDTWKSIKPGGINAGTLFHMAKQNGWTDTGEHHRPSPEELELRQQQRQEHAAAAKAEQAKTASNAQAIWKVAIPAPADHPYLVRKGVEPTSTLREIDVQQAVQILGDRPQAKGVQLQGRLLVAPIMRSGVLSTVELIDEQGNKAALRGQGTKAGGYWSTDRLPETVTNVAICEGVADAITIRMAGAELAVAAFSNSNLVKVAQEMHRLFPGAVLTIVVDLVKDSGHPDPHAIAAARAVGGLMAVPSFGPGREPHQKDANDLMAIFGLDAVRQCLAGALPPMDDDQKEQATLQADETSTGASESVFPRIDERPQYVVLDDFKTDAAGKHRPGVYHCGTKVNKKTGEHESTFDNWICSPLHIEAITFDAQSNNFGRLLRFKTTVGKWREWAMPMELLAGDGCQLRAELLAMGVALDPGSAKFQLPVYLQWKEPKRRMHCALQVGWCGESFVLPDTVIGPGAAGVIFQSGERGHEEHTQAGTLEGWKEGIAAKAVGNPLLMLAVSASFAGPILARCNAEGGGFHIVGDSSTGKTTLIEAACATWGGPGFKRSWRATANGMEGAAAMFNDCLLALDEISECDPKEIGAIVYALGNGSGKQRASRSGNARSVTRWRCLVISSGERTIATAMQEGGHRAKAGQSVRLLDIPAAQTFGAWDTLHGAVSPAAFSDAIKRAAVQHHGHAGRAFLERLTRDKTDFCAVLEEAKAAPSFATDGTEGQDKRAAARFALIGMAGELATEYGLTGWKVGDAGKAAAQAYKLWQAGRGKGNSERKQILQQVAAFIERHGDSRFSDSDSTEDAPVRDRAGWWRDGSAGREYLFTTDGMHEALKGFDFKRALDVLQLAGAIPEPGKNGERSRPIRIAGRTMKLYPVTPDKLTGNEHGA